MLFIMSVNFTEQGIRNIKNAPKRAQAARELAKECGCEIKEVYLTSGDSDLMILVEAANGDNMAKFALAQGSTGNVRTKTCRAWPVEDFMKIVADLP